MSCKNCILHTISFLNKRSRISKILTKQDDQDQNSDNMGVVKNVTKIDELSIFGWIFRTSGQSLQQLYSWHFSRYVNFSIDGKCVLPSYQLWRSMLVVPCCQKLEFQNEIHPKKVRYEIRIWQSNAQGFSLIHSLPEVWHVGVEPKMIWKWMGDVIWMWEHK